MDGRLLFTRRWTRDHLLVEYFAGDTGIAPTWASITAPTYQYVEYYDEDEHTTFTEYSSRTGGSSGTCCATTIPRTTPKRGGSLSSPRSGNASGRSAPSFGAWQDAAVVTGGGASILASTAIRLTHPFSQRISAAGAC
jgi:hypothetical protein